MALSATQTQATNTATGTLVSSLLAAGFDFDMILKLFTWLAANAKALQDLLAIFNPPAGASP